MKIKIEKDIPIPDVISRYKYPFEEMEIGESFFVELGTHQNYISLRESIKLSARYNSRNNGRSYHVSIIESGEKLGVRCWRIR